MCDVSESTLYPVLRRLLKAGDLETYDQAVDGRMRRYYKITPQGAHASGAVSGRLGRIPRQDRICLFWRAIQ